MLFVLAKAEKTTTTLEEGLTFSMLFFPYSSRALLLDWLVPYRKYNSRHPKLLFVVVAACKARMLSHRRFVDRHCYVEEGSHYRTIRRVSIWSPKQQQKHSAFFARAHLADNRQKNKNIRPPLMSYEAASSGERDSKSQAKKR